MFLPNKPLFTLQIFCSFECKLIAFEKLLVTAAPGKIKKSDQPPFTVYSN